MKYALSLFFILCILCLFSCSIINGQAYLPLNIGNKWEFENYNCSGIICNEDEFSVEIIHQDSIMSNGKRYFYIKGYGSEIPEWVRVDSNWVFFYNQSDSSDNPIFNFNANVGDSIYVEKLVNNWVFLERKDTIKNIFNQSTVILSFSFILGWDIKTTILFSDKFGLFGCSVYYFGGYSYSNLKGCVINNTIYGSFTNIAQNISPHYNYYLHQNYPNPFNPTTTISFTIPNSENVELVIYDILGNKITTLLNEFRNAGDHKIEFNAENLASGVFLYRIKSGSFIQTKKLILVK